MDSRTKSMKSELHTTDFGTVRTIEYGRGDTLIILLHGAGSSPAGLSDIAMRLGNDGYHVVAPALSGYMDSKAHVDGTVFDQHNTILHWTAKHFDSQSIILGGHSLGSLIVMEEMVSIQPTAVVLIEPVLLSLLDDNNPRHQSALKDYQALFNVIQHSITEKKPEMAMEAFIDFWSDFKWDQLPAIFSRQLIAMSKQIINELQLVHATKLDHRAIEEFTPPVLLLSGDHSPPITRCILDRLEQTIPNTQRATISEAAHMGPMFRPEPYANEIMQFLNQRTD